MRFQSPTHRKHPRIEIIPLIDVMFFLLASFMMVSLDMTKIENIRVNIPSATQVQNDFGADMIHIAVDKAGKCWVEKQPITLPDLYTLLQSRFHDNAQLPVYIGGDADTHHGDMVAVLDLVRRAGIQKVAFTVTAEPTPGSSGAGG
jgi:biopolymer transport protein ExbD